MFQDALKEFDASVTDIETTLEFVKSSAWLRPRLGGMLDWNILEPTVKPGIQMFLKQDTSGVDTVFRGMIIILAGSFEQLVRRFLKDGVIFISKKYPRYSDLPGALVTQNILRSGQALTTIAEPPDHINLNYELLCENLGTTKKTSEAVILNADAFALFYSGLTPHKLEEVFKRIGFELKWDDIGRRPVIQKLFGVTKTREAATAAQSYLKEFTQNRNRSAHSGSGGKEITSSNVSDGIIFLREFATALSELISAKLTA